MTATTATAPGAPAGPGGLLRSVKGKHNPKVVLAGAAALVVVLALVTKKSPGAPASTDPASVAAGNGAAYDSTANDQYNALAGQMQNLQGQIDATGATTADPATAPAWFTQSISGLSALVTARTAPTVAKPAPAAAKPATKATPKPATKATPKAAPIAQTYTVKAGDTLSAIAARMGAGDWHKLYQANVKVVGANPNLIRPGQKLTIRR